ncbi:hypothetical protein BT69DRAFT_98437 [Atractiella rhizophila]|nr:hypothetical protein BT69DRAFT_98437 [Atractiella rhizophila]
MTSSSLSYSSSEYPRGLLDSRPDSTFIPSSSLLRSIESPVPELEVQEVTEWGEKFWCLVEDPITKNTFYANPTTGECKWDAEPGMMVVPRPPNGEWWELLDDRRHCLYYYNSKSGETSWQKPKGLIIPMIQIQQSAGVKRFSQTLFSSSFGGHGSQPSQDIHSSGHRPVPPLDSPSPSDVEMLASVPNTPSGSEFPSEGTSSRYPSGTQAFTRRRLHNNSIGSSSFFSTDDQDHGDAVIEQIQPSRIPPPPLPRKSSTRFTRYSMLQNLTAINEESGLHSPPLRDPSLPSSPALSSAERDPLHNLSIRDAIASPTSEISSWSQSTSVVRSKRLSTGNHPIMSSDLQAAIAEFSIDGFAKRYFASRKRGLFRREVPLEELMRFQKSPLSAPLLVIRKDRRQDALKAFKSVQRVMGDRDSLWKGNSSSPRSPRGRPSDVTASSSETIDSEAAEPWEGTVLEEARYLVGLGIEHPELRDELYAQLQKQLSSNPSYLSSFRGWRLLCVFLSTFAPSKQLEGSLRSFINSFATVKELRIDVVSQYCLHLLNLISERGSRGRVPSNQEISFSSESAFSPSTFGESLVSSMKMQEAYYPSARVPVILPFLATTIINLGGMTEEGIFRHSPDAEALFLWRLRIDRGDYSYQPEYGDVHVASSLLKLYLRELKDPLIPSHLYQRCIDACDDIPRIVKLVRNHFPVINQRVLAFMTNFLQLFLEPQVVAATRLNAQSLAMIFAPSFFRVPNQTTSCGPPICQPTSLPFLPRLRGRILNSLLILLVAFLGLAS